jgi:hypothetical protein
MYGAIFIASTRHKQRLCDDKIERNKESPKDVQNDKIENVAGSVHWR